MSPFDCVAGQHSGADGKHLEDVSDELYVKGLKETDGLGEDNPVHVEEENPADLLRV